MSPLPAPFFRPLGPISSAVRSLRNSLFTPPQTTIEGISDSLWPNPLQPVQPFQPVGGEPLRYPLNWGQNLIFTQRTDARYDSAQLRDLARYIIARICIDNTKDILAKMPWRVQPKAQPNENRKDRAKRAKKDPNIGKLTKFFERPNPQQDWPTFIRTVLEDLLVIDAPTIYVERSKKDFSVAGLRWVEGACYSDDTEVLTKRGWLKFEDVDIAIDEFATRSEEGVFEWQRASNKIINNYSGELFHFTARNTNILVTPNHNMLTQLVWNMSKEEEEKPKNRRRNYIEYEHKVSKYSALKFTTAEELASDMESDTKAGFDVAIGHPATSTWISTDLPSFSYKGVHRDYSNKLSPEQKLRYASMNKLEFSCTGDDYFAFMGMWLSEGSVSHEKGKLQNTVEVTQKETSKGFSAFKLLMEKIFEKVTYKDMAFRTSHLGLAQYLDQFGYCRQKYVPDLIKNGSSRQIRIFLEYFLLGDGHYECKTNKCLEESSFTTSSKRLAGDLQELIQKIGLASSIRTTSVETTESWPSTSKWNFAHVNGPIYNVTVRTTKNLQYRKVSKVPYDGKVYCVSVPNHTLYVRRNGFPAWCGNSITVLVEEHGWTPSPPSPAYQQTWQGYPRIEFTTDQLVYRPNNIVPLGMDGSNQASFLYGLSPVEAIAKEIEIGIARLQFVYDFYAQGTVPGAILFAPVNTAAAKIKEAQDFIDSDLAGNLAKRRRIQIFQGFQEAGKAEQTWQPKEPILADVFDELHIRKICFAFGTSPMRLMRMMNRGASQTIQEASEEEGTLPWMDWTRRTMNHIVQILMKMPDYEFAFDPFIENDVKKLAEADEIDIKDGLYTRNEKREARGDDPIDSPEADELTVVTSTGVIPLRMAEDIANAEIQSRKTKSPLQSTSTTKVEKTNGHDKNFGCLKHRDSYPRIACAGCVQQEKDKNARIVQERNQISQTY